MYDIEGRIYDWQKRGYEPMKINGVKHKPHRWAKNWPKNLIDNFKTSDNIRI